MTALSYPPLVQSLLTVALLVIVLCMALVLIRALRGPTAHDRILAANAFGSCTVIAIVLLSLIVPNLLFLDVALVYALINFIGTIALLKFVSYGRFDSVWLKEPKA